MPKTERYELAIESLKGLLSGENDRIANLSNAAALLHENFDFLWTGFYLVKGDELVLGPFQGPVACTRIQKGKGVCGTAWETSKSQLVPNVDAFPGHIACSSDSKSEVVIPLLAEGEVIGVLDIDSSVLSYFDQEDIKSLESFVQALVSNW